MFLVLMNFGYNLNVFRIFNLKNNYVKRRKKNIRTSFPKMKCQKNTLNIFSFNYLDIQVLV